MTIPPKNRDFLTLAHMKTSTMRFTEVQVEQGFVKYCVRYDCWVLNDSNEGKVLVTIEKCRFIGFQNSLEVGFQNSETTSWWDVDDLGS